MKNQLLILLQTIRLRNNDRIYDMGIKMGYSSSDISGFEHRRKPLTDDFIEKLFEVYDLTESEKECIRIEKDRK